MPVGGRLGASLQLGQSTFQVASRSLEEQRHMELIDPIIVLAQRPDQRDSGLVHGQPSSRSAGNLLGEDDQPIFVGLPFSVMGASAGNLCAAS